MIGIEPELREYVHAAQQMDRINFCKHFTDPLLISAAADLSELGEGFQTAKTNSNLDIDPSQMQAPMPENVSPVVAVQPLLRDRDDVRIGRREENDLVFNHASISGDQAVIHHLANSNRYALEDLNSTNGTRLNGVSIEPMLKVGLREGDSITFGSCTFLFYTPAGLYDMIREI